MKKISFILATLVIISTLSFNSQALADKPIQLALFNPVQLVPEDQGITGVRLNIYGKNTSLNP